MTQHHNDSPSVIDWLYGLVCSIIILIERIIEGFIKHNGGLEELLYSIISIIFFGFVGASASYFWRLLFRKKKDKNDDEN